jgi:hypothetical protein
MADEPAQENNTESSRIVELTEVRKALDSLDPAPPRMVVTPMAPLSASADPAVGQPPTASIAQSAPDVPTSASDSNS